MTDTISGSIQISASGTRVVATGDATAPSLTLPCFIGNFSKNYNASSSPDGTAIWSGLVALVAGVKTLDLTALTQAGVSSTVDMTGKKLRFIQVIPDSANANPISIGTGASNGYSAFGTLSNLNASDPCIRVTQSATAVDATHKTLDLAGTGTQMLNVLLVFGT